MRRWLWEMARRLRGRCVTAGVAACLLAAPAWALPVHPYQRQPVSRVIDPLMRQILTEMDLSLRNYSPFITIVSGGGGSASFDLSDAAFILHDDADANKKLQFQLSGITTLNTRTLTVPDANGTLPLTNLVQTWTRGQTFRPSADEDAILIDGDGSGVLSAFLFKVSAGGGLDAFAVNSAGGVLLNNLGLNAGTFGVDPTATFNSSALTNSQDYSLPDATGAFVIRTGTPTATRIPFYTGSAGVVVVDSDLSFAADSIVVTKARIPTSIRVGAGQGISVLNFGTWTPTRSAETNLDANVTTFEGQFLQTGNTVTCSGRFTVDATAAVAASFELTLPVASNIGAVEDLAGVAFSAGAAGEGVQVSGSVANNTAVFAWTAVTLTALTYSFTLTYQVI